jgi:S-adenosylmethionine synthetase
MNTRRFYTSESVSEGHPDKVCDQVSDALLDECLKLDPNARVAIETLVAKNLVVIAGEITLKDRQHPDFGAVARKVISEIGYTSRAIGIDAEFCDMMVSVVPQSPDIAQGVETGGAGDQGMMFGMATNETEELMPLPITIAHALMAESAKVRKADPSLGFRPDAKGQVTVVYEDGVPVAIDTVVLSQQHEEDDQEQVRARVREAIIDPVLERYSKYIKGDIKFHINPTGKFVEGGPESDTGLTGRKIIVDTYGGMCPHGGGAFSGKDPTKVDRSAAYMARNVAKCIVAAGLADRAQVALAYAIGVPEPVAIQVDTLGTEKIDLCELQDRVDRVFRERLTPAGIAKHLDLKRPIYRETAKNGHFGHPGFPWEDTKAAEELKQK